MANMKREISSNLGVTLTVFWPHNRNDPPSDRDIIAVATGVVPE
jgi:hypothetical protein